MNIGQSLIHERSENVGPNMSCCRSDDLICRSSEHAERCPQPKPQRKIRLIGGVLRHLLHKSRRLEPESRITQEHDDGIGERFDHARTRTNDRDASGKIVGLDPKGFLQTRIGPKQDVRARTNLDRDANIHIPVGLSRHGLRSYLRQDQVGKQIAKRGPSWNYGLFDCTARKLYKYRRAISELCQFGFVVP